MARDKHPMNIRFQDHVRRQIRQLAYDYRVSQRVVLETALEIARKHWAKGRDLPQTPVRP